MVFFAAFLFLSENFVIWHLLTVLLVVELRIRPNKSFLSLVVLHLCQKLVQQLKMVTFLVFTTCPEVLGEIVELNLCGSFRSRQEDFIGNEWFFLEIEHLFFQNLFSIFCLNRLSCTSLLIAPFLKIERILWFNC